MIYFMQKSKNQGTQSKCVPRFCLFFVKMHAITYYILTSVFILYLREYRP